LVEGFQEKQVQKKPLLAESMEKSIFTKPEEKESPSSQTSSTYKPPGLNQKQEGE